MDDPKRLYTIAEITEALTLRGSLQDQIDDLKRQVASLSAQIAELRANDAPRSIDTRSKALISRKEAAAVLSISVSTLEQLIIQGEIKTRSLGRRVLIPREQLDRLAQRDVRVIWPDKRQGKTVRK
jgi:excisionase family DNA binding protein